MEIRCLPDKRLSEAEESVIAYINQQRCIIHLLTITDIAEGAFVSNATVSRAIRKCGFGSLSEMKFRLTEDAKEDRQTYEMNRILSKSYTECLETIKQIDIGTVIEIVRMLRHAKVVYLLANGLTALIANEFAVQLQCQRINVCLISDSEMMRKMDLLAREGDLILILSVKNSRPELGIGARLGRKAGAAVVTCCCTRGTELDGLSDRVLYGYTQSIYSNRSFGGISRLGLLIITRTIVEYMASDVELDGSI
ncbi:MAG: MurR/RpiR family transcriptional regulator [Clostridia bacterium]|nr:MurR/RpiR family transcriptional regulator [Clostridia bacterium]